VDIGAIWNQTYTVLAGGTHSDFPGVAKLINFHHIEWACRQRFKEVDFLCGEFNWKNRFHLTARPLYRILNLPVAAANLPDAAAGLRVACAV
jgi:CelD/BcsL family acetyltransferase involved in cellulose biosynthesis